MSIKFNKVTWYSKLAALILLLATFFLAAYIGVQYNKVSLLSESIPSSGTAVSANGYVALTVGTSETVEGLGISLNKVVKDNRCPIDVQCFQAGSVTTQVTMSSAGNVEEKNIASDGVPYRFDNYSLPIVRTAPMRNSKIEIDPNNYIVVFKVTKEPSI